MPDKGAAKRAKRRAKRKQRRKRRRREMKHLRRCLLTVAVMCCTTLSAQYSDILHLYADSAARADKLTVTLDADILSKYVWRGYDMGDISLQPELGLEWRGLRLSFSGSTPLNNSRDDQYEFNIQLNYSIGHLALGVYDQWSEGTDGRYFNYKLPGTSHTFEASVAYDFGFAQLAWATNFAGWDHLATPDEEDPEYYGYRTFSSYIEAAVPFTYQDIEWVATLGIVPWKSFFYYTRTLAVTNIALKGTYDIPVTKKFSLPVFAEFIANPRQEHFYFVLGASLSLF